MTAFEAVGLPVGRPGAGVERLAQEDDGSRRGNDRGPADEGRAEAGHSTERNPGSSNARREQQGNRVQVNHRRPGLPNADARVLRTPGRVVIDPSDDSIVRVLNASTFNVGVTQDVCHVRALDTGEGCGHRLRATASFASPCCSKDLAARQRHCRMLMTCSRESSRRMACTQRSGEIGESGMRDSVAKRRRG